MSQSSVDEQVKELETAGLPVRGDRTKCERVAVAWVRVQINRVTSDAKSQISIAIHAKVTTAMTPIVIQRTIVPTARLKAPADEIGGV